MFPLNSNLASNAKELPKLWKIQGKYCFPRDLRLDIVVSDKKGNQAKFIIKNANTALLSLIKVTVTRRLMKATKADFIDDVVKEYNPN